MKYIGNSAFEHGQPGRIGVLITNLGTPDAPEKSALRRYLKQFLADPRVVEAPRWLWWWALHGVILNVRPARSARSYRKIWTESGSPLLVHTREQAEALQQLFTRQSGDEVLVDFAMNYGQPSIHDAITRLQERGVRKLLVMPLYPQYSGPSTAATFDALAADFQRRRWLPELRFLNQYHDHPQYIDALAASIRAHWQAHGRTDKLVFSFHGAPLSYLEAGDPYFCQCHKTTRLVAAALALSEADYMLCFQSRFGREQWLQPYLDHTLKELPSQGVKSVAVICPGFAVDCLETLEEVAIENREYFMESGGERYQYIPCMNAEPVHINALASIVQEQIQGWLGEPDHGALSARLALQLGARQ